MKHSLDNKSFRSAGNTENGEVGSETIFHYHQEKARVWAEYSGGEIVQGHLIGLINEAGKLEMVYHHINVAGKLKTGKCMSTIEALPSGKLRLHENWQWTCDDFSEGESVVEEV
jgi:hypothetical protein